MERKVPIKLLISLIAVAILLLFSLLLFVFFLNEGSFGGVFIKPELSLAVEADGEPLFRSESTNLLSKGNHTLVIQNKDGHDVRASFFAGSQQIGEVTVKKGKSVTLDLSLEEEKPISAVVSGKGNAVGYLSAREALLSVTEVMPEGGDLVFFGGVTLPEVTLSAPFRFYGSFDFQSLSIATPKEGQIVLSPEVPFQGDLYVFAPKSKVYFHNFSLAASQKSRNYYIKAKSLNGDVLDPGAYPVNSWKELSRLGDEKALPQLCEDAVVTFTAPFRLESDVHLSGHSLLIFQKKIDFSEYRITLSASSSGTFRVVTGTDTAPTATQLLFDAPESALIWESDGSLLTTIPAMSTVERYSNLDRYNGVKTTLGGKGSATPALTLFAHDNAFLEADAAFLPEGNRLIGILPYNVSFDDLKNASFDLSASKGTVTLEGDLATGRVVTVDENGLERRFAVELRREAKNIPVLYIETEGREEITSKSQYLSATFSLDGADTKIESVPETHIRVRGRGNSTWKWEKKPYKIHFDEPVSILGLPAAEEWALFSNYADKSLMRNRLAQKMASTLSFEYCPTQEYVDLFLNGEYLGVYTIGEHLEEGVGRVEVTHDMSRRDCGYFMEAGGVVSGVDVKGMNYFHAGLVKFVLVKGPEYNTLTSEQFEFIKQYMLSADRAVKSGEGYEEYLDMETLVDWLIMIELTNNTDCAWRRSTYFTKDPGEKLKLGPVWDFDLAFGNFSKDVEGFNTWVSTSDDDYVGETWSTHLLEDPEFREAFRSRWRAVKDDLLEFALCTIDEDYETLYPSAQANFDRWDILGRKVAFERHDTKYYKTYASQIQYLKDFLVKRAAWIDGQVEAW
ncbi:MAG: CotH kinase family protein [Clostridia bacterium]|nr:CotH kinase family protein [Clostridia bacterium]